jgi:hypothetical protein|tara:strand:- start:161 stop:364 length:204 start_codon:yes stop_codon:yes gene_type:complete
MDKLDRFLKLDIGTIKIHVELDDEGVLLNVLKNTSDQIGFCRRDEIIESKRKSYSDFGLEIKELIDE